MKLIKALRSQYRLGRFILNALELGAWLLVQCGLIHEEQEEEKETKKHKKNRKESEPYEMP